MALPTTQGVERYGFHGLSYEFLMAGIGPAGRAPRRHAAASSSRTRKRASLAAVLGGKSIDTSMGFTPAAGLVMSTRSGDLDPGLLAFLVRRDRYEPGAV